jgi:thioredoxin reductase
VESKFDVVIVGGGPAGLSGALLLGRCRRRVLVCDSGRYRNAATHAVHGFLSRDGIAPDELREIGRQQLACYDIEIRHCTVKGVEKREDHFRVMFEDGGECLGRRLLVATGMVDQLPEIQGIKSFYGSSVHHCPYCDAWDHRDQPMAAYGKDRAAYGLALSLKTWTEKVTLLTDGACRLSKEEREQLDLLGIEFRTDRVLRLEGEGGKLERIQFQKGDPLACQAIFFNTGQHQQCSVGGMLGCVFTQRGAIKVDRFERTNIPGVYAAGDCSRNVQFVSVAAAQGSIAAEQINIELQEEDRRRILEKRTAPEG